MNINVLLPSYIILGVLTIVYIRKSPNQKIFIANIASNIVPTLLDKNPNGMIHSVFNTSFNLIFGTHIIHVGSEGNGLAPFGVGLEQGVSIELTKQMTAVRSVQWNQVSKRIEFSNGTLLQLNNARLIDHSLPKVAYEYSVLRENYEYVCRKIFDAKWEIGFVQSSAEKDVIIHYLLSENHLSYNDATLLRLNELGVLAKGKGEGSSLASFNYWIGRGSGLTPSGDDLATGICAVLSTLNGQGTDFQEMLKDYVVKYGRERTTQIGYEYLLYATNGAYHSHLVELCTALLKPEQLNLDKALEEMGKIGHTSGADTLLGILLAIKYVALTK